MRDHEFINDILKITGTGTHGDEEAEKQQPRRRSRCDTFARSSADSLPRCLFEGFHTCASPNQVYHARRLTTEYKTQGLACRCRSVRRVVAVESTAHAALQLQAQSNHHHVPCAADQRPQRGQTSKPRRASRVEAWLKRRGHEAFHGQFESEEIKRFALSM